MNLSIIFTILSLLFFFTSTKGGKYFKLRNRISTLSLEVKELQEQNLELTTEIEKLKNDKKYLEEVARSKFGLLKKNEIVFDFKESPKKK